MKTLILILTTFAFTIESAQIERKLKSEVKYNQEEIRSLLCAYQVDKLKNELDNPSTNQMTSDLKNIILNYLKTYFVAGPYDEDDKNRIFSLLKMKCLRANVIITNTALIRIVEQIIEVVFDDKSIKKLLGHTKEVICIIDLPNDYLASTDGREIKIWNLTTCECVKTLKTKHITHSLLPLPDEYLATGSNKTFEIWNLKTCECEITLEIPEPIYMLMMLENGDIVIYHPNTFKTEQITLVKNAFDIILSTPKEEHADNKCCLIQ